MWHWNWNPPRTWQNDDGDMLSGEQNTVTAGGVSVAAMNSACRRAADYFCMNPNRVEASPSM
jgi:hypothetical protein